LPHLTDNAAGGDGFVEAERGLAELPLETMGVTAGGRLWTLTAARDQDRLLEAAQSCAIFPFGLLLWESAIALSDVLAEEAAVLPGLEVLELGAGTGLAGLVAASLGARVVQTDYSPQALALCRRNAAANGIEGLAFQIGDWTKWPGTHRYRLVIGADVLYEPDLYEDLENVLRACVAPGGRLLLTDPGRIHANRFVDRLKRGGWDVAVGQRIIAALPPSAPGDTVAVNVISAKRTR
jgi:predicted nicotinamide N-methyase